MKEKKAPPQIVDLEESEIYDMLDRIHFGHLGVTRGTQPYVVPIHFAFGRPGIYFYTTEGLKTEILDENPQVCLQLEEIHSATNWKSVIVFGTVERMKTERQIDDAMRLLKKINPSLSPAWSVRWLDEWVRSNVEVVYRISTDVLTGRGTLKT